MPGIGHGPTIPLPAPDSRSNLHPALGRQAELVEAALSAHGRRLVVVDDAEVDDDLVRDMVEVLASLCARLYGRRSARNRALKALGCAQRDVGPRAVGVTGAGENRSR